MAPQCWTMPPGRRAARAIAATAATSATDVGAAYERLSRCRPGESGEEEGRAERGRAPHLHAVSAQQTSLTREETRDGLSQALNVVDRMLGKGAHGRLMKIQVRRLFWDRPMNRRRESHTKQRTTLKDPRHGQEPSAFGRPFQQWPWLGLRRFR